MGKTEVNCSRCVNLTSAECGVGVRSRYRRILLCRSFSAEFHISDCSRAQFKRLEVTDVVVEGGKGGEQRVVSFFF